MVIPEPCVQQFSLTVDVAETIGLMVENADNPWGRRLHDALSFAMAGDVVFAVSPYVAVPHAVFAPDAQRDSADIWEVGGRSVCDVLGSLEKAGLISTRTVLHESPSETYLSDGRIVTAVNVLRPFALVSVAYRRSSQARFTLGYADTWEITDRSYIVPVGWYLVGEVGEYVYDLSGVAGVAGDSDDTLCWLFDIEGFDASHCSAGCSSCGSRWAAESGSWTFDPDCCDACTWSFDDAEDFEDNTIGCPQCRTGRVGFMIF
ncbi:hypothetical protein [Kibdelosporangium aridum]|uniref:hypothetical protein n=1 Tax=Kibdelosporangium aridum TaxID=2030 RepID=UPI0035EFEEAB